MVNLDYSIEEIPVISLIIVFGGPPTYLTEASIPHLINVVGNLYKLPLLVRGSGILARILRPPSIDRDTSALYEVDIFPIGPALTCRLLMLCNHLMDELQIVLHTFFPSNLSISYCT